MSSSKQQALLVDIETQLRDNYPSLCLTNVGRYPVIRGSFPVRLDRKVLDRFLIEFILLRHFPKNVPLVREMGGRIPKIADRHVYEGDALCLFLPEERAKYWPEGSSFLDFLTGPVNDFFLSQLYFERHGKWSFGERRHGALGIIDYYAEELGTNNLQVIARCLEYLSAPQPKGHWLCFCGSGKKLRHCHFGKISELHQKIQPAIAANSLTYIRQLIKRQTELPRYLMRSKI